jgi:hypothetical protein
VATIAPRAQLKRSRRGRREDIFPMFVGEQRQRVWPVQPYAGCFADNVALSLLLVSEPSLPTVAVGQVMRPPFRRLATVLLKK